MTTRALPERGIFRGLFWRKLLLSLAVLAGSAAYVRQVALHPPRPDEEVDPPAAPAPADGATGAALVDGIYPGSIEDAHYGELQVRISVENGRLARIRHAKYPHHTSASDTINQRAFRSLFKQAIANQSAEVDVVSGATYTSEAFRKSLETALAAARK